MKKLSLLLCLLLSLSLTYKVSGQIATTKTESYTASFEKKINIDSLMDYDGPTIPIQLLSLGINEDVYASYPELKDKRVGLGVTNIVVEYLEETNRFIFTEDKAEIKNRMVKQFQASQSGITQDKLDGRGKIRLAKYFVYIEVYDFSISEDESLSLKDGVKQTVVTRLGLQVRFVDAQSGEVIVGSGLGEAVTVKESTMLGDIDEVKFNQSTIGITTKKSLETASSRIVSKLIKKGVFPQ